MYTYIGLGLMSVFAMMIIPGNFDTVNNELVFYGAGTITQFDKDGYEIFSQTVHNRVINEGEDFVIDQVFEDTVTVADNLQMGSICITDEVGFVDTSETTTAALFDTGNLITETNCKEVVGTTTGSIATVNPAVFTCGGTNCADGDNITGFAVCQNSAAGGDYLNCATNGVALAVINSADTILNTGETLDITYNFDITSTGS